MVIVNGCNNVKLTSNTTFLELRLGTASSGIEQSSVTGDGNTSPPFTLKAIQQMELNPYLGESDKYIEWYESTVRRFGWAAAEPLLHDVAL